MDVYKKDDVVHFRRNKEAYGILSNMYPTPVEVNGIAIRTSEALYQACKFPNYPLIQKKIIDQVSPMVAKWEARVQRDLVRDDWFDRNVEIMAWCVWTKLIQNPDTFGKALLDTGDDTIVENSSKDTFWGAKPKGSLLIGNNTLGKILMKARETYKTVDENFPTRILPLDIPNFKIYNEEIKPYYE